MASYLNPHGIEVSAADAMIGGKLRPGFKEILADGERISFDMLFMRDAKAKGPDFSVDADKRARDATEFMRKNRYSGFGKFIEAADSDTPARPTIPSGVTQTDAIAYLRKARYAQ